MTFCNLLLVALACVFVVGCGSTKPARTKVIVEPSIVGCVGEPKDCQRRAQQEVRAAERKLAHACPTGETLVISGGLTSARCVKPVPQSPAIETPRAVKRAGGRTLSEFKAGATVLAQTGCLACHRIGAVGNHGPGPDLTTVGGRLSAGQIERAIIHAREPMPSFSRLPMPELRALVQFLGLLR